MVLHRFLSSVWLISEKFHFERRNFRSANDNKTFPEYHITKENMRHSCWLHGNMRVSRMHPRGTKLA